MPDTKQAIVTAATRRYVDIFDGELKRGKTASRSLEPCIGDQVLYEEADEVVISSICERKNCLLRSYGNKQKQLAANLDQLFVVCAPKPLFNTTFTDRILVAANMENIPTSLVVNKADLEEELEESRELIEIYRPLVEKIYFTSAKQNHGINNLQNELQQENFSLISFAGVSGVGKSSLLNKLIPDAEARTGDISEKTGQGKQTTSSARAYEYAKGKYLIDLPGIQNYGLTHLDEEQVRGAFEDFNAVKSACKFSNCRHIDEPNCAVLEAIDNGEIAKTRYNTYREILDELKQFAPY